MKRLVFLCVAILILAPLPVAAQSGLRLAWTNCLSDGGVSNKNFACNSNSGSNVLIGSYVPPVALTAMSGNEITVDLQSASGTLPTWWQFKNTGTCRTTSLAASFNAPGTATNCLDAWSGQASGGIGTYAVGYGGAASRARIVMAVAIPAPNTLSIPALQDTYSFTLTINNQKTVGSSCTGCTTPVCIALTSIKINQSIGVGDVLISNQDANSRVTWQSALLTSCPLQPSTVPTWGAIRSLMR